MPTAGSRNAKRHISTKGKRDSTGRILVRVAVASVHVFSMAGYAEGRAALPLVVPPAAGVVNLALRYGTIAAVSICLISFFDSAEDADQGAVSIKDVSFLRTVSREGTWVKRIGSRERDSMAGRDSDVCG